MTTTPQLALPIPLADTPETPKWFRADWLNVTFMHFEIDPQLLQPHVPFDLDLHHGKAWISLVTFTQSDLRPTRGGTLTAWLTRPIAHHAFLNLRTYVKAHGRSAIYFLAEWIPNRLSFLTGPALYGLPFRLAEMTYTKDASTVRASGMFHVEHHPNIPHDHSPDLAEFLLERYTAFTCRNAKARMFHIAHNPWPWRNSGVRITDDTLIRRAAPWFADAHFVCAHTSPGVRDIEIGRPIHVNTTRPIRQNPSPLLTWTPLALLPVLAVILGRSLPTWAYMWAIAYTLFFASKWATWRLAPDAARQAPRWKSLAYLFAWPGMDARPFLSRSAPVPPTKEWLFPIIKTLAGLAILFTVPRMLPPQHPILAAWAGMTGLILAMHFGSFELLALFWQRFGISAKPIMNAPWRSRTLGEFWGQRWNRGFRDLSHGWLFRPLLPRLGPFGATYITFVVSGLVHDLVISTPARAGFFLPTLYFLFQGAGLLIERTPFAKRHTRNLVGRLFTIAVVTLPAPLLFHSSFILRVIVPFFRSIGAM
jgi:alginate O-acetyltransferase complex protein AlgI